MGSINRAIMRFVKFIFLGIAFLSFVCCYTSKREQCPDSYGLDYNDNRLELGMPIIEPDWIIHDCDTNFVYWSNRQNRVLSESPVHLWKRVYLSSKNLVKEEDVFHYESNTDKAYRLVVHWYPDNINSSDFRLITYFKGMFPPTTGQDIILSEADSIMKTWGFESLSFGQK